MKVSNQDMMFQSYPDVLNVKDLQNALECRCYNDVRQEEKKIANRSGL